MPPKPSKVLIRRKKFIEVDIPAIRSKVELIGNSAKELEGKTIKLDLTRQLKGKSIEAVAKIRLENDKPVAYPEKIKLMPYFIRRMIRKRISYVEDSFLTPSQESMFQVKPFLITRKKVSKAVRKTLRNKCKNWTEDYISQKKDNDLFTDVLSNRMQKQLSLVLKKTYPLSLCEIRILEKTRSLRPEEVPKIIERPKEERKEEKEEFIDQMAEIEEEKIKQAEKDIKDTQEIAISREDTSKKPLGVVDKEEKPKKERKPRKKKEEKTEAKE